VRRYPDMRTVALAALVAAAAAAACSGQGGGAPETTQPAAAVESVLAPTRDLLPSLGLRTSDLGIGFSVRRERYVPVEGPVEAAYRRVFDPGSGRVHDSVVTYVDSDVALFESEDAAAKAFDGIVDALTGPAANQEFSAIVRTSSGVEATSVRGGQTLTARSLGDGAVVARARFETGAGRAEGVFAVVRVGEIHGAIFLAGLPGQIDLADVTRLAKVIATRIEKGAGAGDPEA
jgi:hypothetical protein